MKRLKLGKPNPFEKEIDVEELACAKYNVKDGIRDYDERYYNTINVAKAEAFIEGYKAAQSKQLELLKRVIQLASDAENIEEVEEEIIQSLSTQQLPVSFEPKYEVFIDFNWVKEEVNHINRLKTTTNSEGKEELLGTYKY